MSRESNTAEQRTDAGGTPNLFQILQGLAELNSVEELIRSKLTSDAPLLREVPSYLLELGGKRIRPVLTLLVAHAFGNSTSGGVAPEVIDVAAGIELIHMATLLHDDIIDKSSLRRHRESPFIKFGLGNTLLAGDFLLVRAFSLCARLDRFIIDSTEQACVELTEGEILETPLYRDQHSLESSLTIAEKKTAALFWLAARSGAHLATKQKDLTDLLSSFGRNLGIAFQILDDILDVSSTEDLLGKRSGADLLERKPSIINVMWLASGSALAQRLLVAPQPSEVSPYDYSENEHQFREMALEELRQGRIVEEAKKLATNYALQARSELTQAAALRPAIEPQKLAPLYELVQFTLDRMQ